VSSELKPQKIEHEKNHREGEIWMRVERLTIEEIVKKSVA